MRATTTRPEVSRSRRWTSPGSTGFSPGGAATSGNRLDHQAKERVLSLRVAAVPCAALPACPARAGRVLEQHDEAGASASLPLYLNWASSFPMACTSSLDGLVDLLATVGGVGFTPGKFRAARSASSGLHEILDGGDGRVLRDGTLDDVPVEQVGERHARGALRIRRCS